MSTCTVEVSIVPETEQFFEASRPLCTSTGYVTFPDADTLEGKIRVSRSTSGNEDGYVIRYDADTPQCSLWGQCSVAIVSLIVNFIIFVIMAIIFFIETAKFSEYQKKLQFKQPSFAGFATKVT